MNVFLAPSNFNQSEISTIYWKIISFLFSASKNGIVTFFLKSKPRVNLLSFGWLLGNPCRCLSCESTRLLSLEIAVLGSLCCYQTHWRCWIVTRAFELTLEARLISLYSLIPAGLENQTYCLMASLVMITFVNLGQTLTANPLKLDFRIALVRVGRWRVWGHQGRKDLGPFRGWKGLRRVGRPLQLQENSLH